MGHKRMPTDLCLISVASVDGPSRKVQRDMKGGTSSMTSTGKTPKGSGTEIATEKTSSTSLVDWSIDIVWSIDPTPILHG